MTAEQRRLLVLQKKLEQEAIEAKNDKAVAFGERFK